MLKNGRPSTSPTSYTWTMCGWCRRGDRFRLGVEALLPVRAAGAGQDHLDGDDPVEAELRALYTTPMPPRPSSARIS